MKVKDPTGLTLSIAKRYYRFLFATNKEDILALSRNADFLLAGKPDIGEASRTIQRHLYRIATEAGWRRQRGAGWEKKEVLTFSPGDSARA